MNDFLKDFASECERNEKDLEIAKAFRAKDFEAVLRYLLAEKGIVFCEHDLIDCENCKKCREKFEEEGL